MATNKTKRKRHIKFLDKFTVNKSYNDEYGLYLQFNPPKDMPRKRLKNRLISEFNAIIDIPRGRLFTLFFSRYPVALLKTYYLRNREVTRELYLSIFVSNEKKPTVPNHATVFTNDLYMERFLLESKILCATMVGEMSSCKLIVREFYRIGGQIHNKAL
jgi:hypothetical protein